MKPRVIMVDDQEFSLAGLERLVAGLPDVEPFSFLSSAQALQEAAALAPDLFIVDYSMPKPDGFAFLLAIRADPAMAEIPIVIVTADEDRDVCYRALDIGANDFLVRPIDPREFVSRIGNLLALQATRKGLASALAEKERHLHMHERRLNALWSVAAEEYSVDDDYLRAVLANGASGLSTTIPFQGIIAHVDGPELVVDFATAKNTHFVDGSRLPLTDTLLIEVWRAGSTCSWRDIQAEPLLPNRLGARQRGVRAFIGTAFAVGNSQFCMSFASSDVSPEFTAFEHSYVEILASLCMARLQRRAQLERIAFEAQYDALTGIANRAKFRAETVTRLAAGERIAVAIADIDALRDINETHGHQAGDAILIEAAAALDACDPEDVVARYSGDSFAILLGNAFDRVESERRVRRYVEIFTRPFLVGHRDGEERAHVSASVGIADSAEDGDSYDRLMTNAEAALAAAKVAGRGQYAFHDRRTSEAFAFTRRTRNELARALARDEFVLHFQPHVELISGKAVGAEALIRWDHPSRGLLAPGDFLALAEQNDMMRPIGAWVLGETVRRSAAWRSEFPGFSVWFNLSAAELADRDLPARVRDFDGQLEGVGVEITESTAMRDVDQTRRTVTLLREAGLHVALDDFGTAYSSLGHLKRIPLDTIKIDQMFVAGLPGDAHDRAIVDAVLSIAHHFGFSVIAEGIETREQRQALATAACHIGQGYLFARPMTDVLFEAWLRRNIREHASAAFDDLPKPSSLRGS